MEMSRLMTTPCALRPCSAHSGQVTLTDVHGPHALDQRRRRAVRAQHGYRHIPWRTGAGSPLLASTVIARLLPAL